MGAIAFIALCLCAGSDAGLIEDTSYMLMKKAMIAQGYSASYTNCFVTVVKYSGVTKDVTDLRNIADPKTMWKKVNDKADFANFVCSPAGGIVIVLLFCFIFGICCVCLKRCMCRSKEPIIIQMASPQWASNNAKIPYARMDVA